jgi:hypothetical protein
VRQRGAVRIVPRSPITVAIQAGEAPYAYGVVANISEAGACIWTDASLEPGTSLSLRLSFPRGSKPFGTDGLVVWGEPPGEGGSRRFGLQWTDQSPPGRERLKGLIAASA